MEIRQIAWEAAPHEGLFHRRYQRFFADVELAGQAAVAHVPNTGSLRGHIETMRPALLSHHADPARKLKWTLEALQTSAGVWVGVNTQRPNRIIRACFEQKLIADWLPYTEFKSEVRVAELPQSRLDAKLVGAGLPNRYVEVKSVTMAEGSCALFPDAKTERGLKHLGDLMAIVGGGDCAEIVFVIQRADCDRFAPAELIDPKYAEKLREAVAAGVTLRLLRVEISSASLTVRELPKSAGVGWMSSGNHHES